jgi:DNA-directed RNA polymerase, alpha subunit/40 kD subunit
MTPPTNREINEVRVRSITAYPDEIVSKLPNLRLQRVVRARAAGKHYWEIAETEHCSIERARQLWHNAQRLLTILVRSPKQITGETRLADLIISVRLYNVCIWNGIVTVGDLANCTLRDLLCIKHCGRKTAREAVELLNRAGLQLKSSASDGDYWIRQAEKFYGHLETRQ